MKCGPRASRREPHMWPWKLRSSGTVIIAPGLLKHLPECALPLARLLVLLLDPKGDLHHASRDIPIAPQRLHSLVIIARPRSLVEERPPSVLVFTNQFDL